MSKKSKKLVELAEIFKQINIDFNKLNDRGIKDMITIIKKQEDNRYQPNVKHKIEDVVLITLFAVLAKCNEWTEIESFARKKEKWLKKHLGLKNGIPSHDTIQRVISIINPETLYSDCINYLINKIDLITSNDNNKDKDILSMDGKVSKGSGRNGDNTNEIKPVNTMSIYSHNYGITLVQDYISEKSNEIPMGPNLIKKLDLHNCILTADALNTQKDTATAIKDAHGDYVLALKKNQKNFYEDIKDYLSDNDILNEIENFYEETEKSHSKIVTRKYYMTSNIKWLNGKEKWDKLKSIGVEKKIIESVQTGEIKEEDRYFIISFKDDIKTFADAVRKHWGVENNLHAPLDIVFKEDSNKTLEKNGSRNLGIIRRIALALLRFIQSYYNISLNLIRTNISFDFENEVENIFKLLDVEMIKSLKNT